MILTISKTKKMWLLVGKRRLFLFKVSDRSLQTSFNWLLAARARQMQVHLRILLRLAILFFIFIATLAGTQKYSLTRNNLYDAE